MINNAGTVVGEGDTSNPDVQHAFRWQKGVLTDLGVLPGGHFSHPLLCFGVRVSRRSDLDVLLCAAGLNGISEEITEHPLSIA